MRALWLKWEVPIVAAVLFVVMVVACPSGPDVLLGSEITLHLEKGEAAPDEGWYLTDAAFARIQELIALQDAKIRELEAKEGKE